MLLYAYTYSSQAEPTFHVMRSRDHPSCAALSIVAQTDPARSGHSDPISYKIRSEHWLGPQTSFSSKSIASLVRKICMHACNGIVVGAHSERQTLLRYRVCRCPSLLLVAQMRQGDSPLLLRSAILTQTRRGLRVTSHRRCPRRRSSRWCRPLLSPRPRLVPLT